MHIGHIDNKLRLPYARQVLRDKLRITDKQILQLQQELIDMHTEELSLTQMNAISSWLAGGSGAHDVLSDGARYPGRFSTCPVVTFDWAKTW